MPFLDLDEALEELGFEPSRRRYWQAIIRKKEAEADYFKVRYATDPEFKRRQDARARQRERENPERTRALALARYHKRAKTIPEAKKEERREKDRQRYLTKKALQIR